MSSGEQQILSLVAKILAHAEQGCLVLIDEPEISLHVAWQRVLPNVFSAVAKRFQCFILVATHSPMIVSSASTWRSHFFSARSRRLVRLTREDRVSLEATLFSGFGTHTVNNRIVNERTAAIVASAVELASKARLNEDAVRALQAELGDMRRTVSAQAESWKTKA